MKGISTQLHRLRFWLGLFTLLVVLDGVFIVVILGWIDFEGWDGGLYPADPAVQAGWISPTVDATINSSAADLTMMPVAMVFTSSPTPFLPSTYTPTATVTPTPTPTRTPSPTPTSTPTFTPSPTATGVPSPTPLPESAQVSGVSGVNQALPLSCESRSAVDWARFFGFKLNELEFQYALPRTDNPETGFVGDPRGNEGMLPPRSYGVYPGPVADLLHTYGVPAKAYRGLGLDDIRREIAQGRPVIVWVIGAVQYNPPIEYTASDGQTTVVAVMEHTVMVVGYSSNSVLIQDGSYRYYVSLDRFRQSWGVLGNRAIFSN